MALGSGDPVGVKDQFSDCLERFVAEAREQRLRPVVMLARHDRLSMYERLGFKAFYLGDEAILDVDTFTLDSPRLRNARQAVKRSMNFGVTAEVMREADIPASQIAPFCARSPFVPDTASARRDSRPRWRNLSPSPNRTASWPCAATARRARRLPRYSLCSGGTKLSADAMRRVSTAPNGTNERMIFEVLQWARGNGIVEVSLNFVAFRRQLQHLDVATGNGAVPRAVRRLNPAGAPTLYTFTNKFRPRWVPRYLAYRSLADIPGYAIATLSAEGRLAPWVARVGARRAAPA